MLKKVVEMISDEMFNNSKKILTFITNDCKMSKIWLVIGRISKIFFTITKIFLESYVKKIFFKNFRLGMFLATFLFFWPFQPRCSYKIRSK